MRRRVQQAHVTGTLGDTSTATRDRIRSIKPVIRELQTSILRNELAVLVGAGISRNSGLPTAGRLIETMMQTLKLKSEVVQEIRDSRIPFEAFMEALSHHSDINRVVELFRRGEPNNNHFLIAKMASAGHLSLIVTTNFDLLLEKAFKEYGLIKSQNYVMHFSDLGSLMPSPDLHEVTLVKLHGSAHEPESVRATLRSVAARTLSTPRQELVKHLFSSGPHKKLLVMGYSCSDNFDINPAIERINGNRKEIILVDHDEKYSGIEDVSKKRKKDEPNPFKNFKGTRIVCDTDLLINGLCQLVGEREHGAITTIDWEKNVIDWTHSISSVKWKRHLMAAGIFRLAGDPTKTIECLRTARCEIERSGAIERMGPVLASMWDSYVEIGEKAQAHAIYEEFVRLGRRLSPSDRDSKHDLMLLLGSTSRPTLVVVPRVRDKMSLAEQFMAYGKMMFSEGEPEKSMQLLEAAKRCADRSADESSKKIFLPGYWLERGILFAQQGDREENESATANAVECFDLSAQLSEETGDLLTAAVAHSNLEALLVQNYRLVEGISFGLRALKTAENIKNSELQAKSCLWLGGAYLKLANLGLKPQTLRKTLGGHRLSQIVFGNITNNPKQNVAKAIKYFGRVLSFGKTQFRHDAEINLERAHRLKVMVNRPKRSSPGCSLS